MNRKYQSLFATPEPPALGPGPRAGVMDEASIRQACSKVWSPEPAEPKRFEAFVALILLWHDHHEESHEIAQAIADADGSYVHAILHRREPDYANAKYWFRRVGRHPAYAELGRRVVELLRGPEASALAYALVPGGRWEPMTFVDACEAAAGKGKGMGRSGDRALLLEIQRIEFETLAEHFLEPPVEAL